MANLPPRPESPPRLRDDRDRHIIDDRDRDRPGPSAQPMAPRPFRGDRIPERERTYVPRSRTGDTYFPTRDGDRRERDRDWDRRGGRGWGRERERSPRRWDPRPGPPRRYECLIIYIHSADNYLGLTLHDEVPALVFNYLTLLNV